MNSTSDILSNADRVGIATTASAFGTSGWRKPVGTAFRLSGMGWLLVAILGQLLFAGYVVAFYGRAALAGRFEDWDRGLPHGFVPGELWGNLVVASHLLFTVAVVLAAAVQLLPVVRRRWPHVHRWNGRMYLASAAILSLGGLFMMLTRGAVGDVAQQSGIAINGVLILVCAAFVYRHARARRFDLHRRWALRLFLLVSGVWFFRIGLMFWVVVNQGPVGFDPTSFTGPTLVALAFGQYLLPLALLELYFRAQNAGVVGQLAMTAILVVAMLGTAGGIAAAWFGMWLPRL